MNKLFLYLTLMLIGALTFIGCESSQLGGVPDTKEAPLVTLEEISAPEIDLGDPTASLTMRINKAGENTASVVYKISQSTDFATAVAWKTIDTFPSEHTITMAEITSLIGAVVPGRIYFHAEVTGEDGMVTTFANLELEGDFANPGQAQGMRFDVVAFCNYVPSATSGEWTMTTSTWNSGTLNIMRPGVRTIEANADHFIIKEIAGPGTGDLRVDVSPSGALTIERQFARNIDEFYGANNYGDMTLDGTGTVFSCIGQMSMRVTRRVSLGSFGGMTITLTKN